MAIANARMYSIDPESSRLWKLLLEWVLENASLPFEVIDYPAPQPLSTLWARDDLGAVFMCGLPYSLTNPRPQLIAAPVPSPARYANQPRYMTDLVVRADSPYRQVEDTFGGIAGYTVTGSQSGYFAFRHFLSPYHAARSGPQSVAHSPAQSPALYRDVIGNLINARGVIDALAAGRIDVGPLDSYCHDLLQRHQPEFAAQVRTIATTGPTPIPVFVASPSLSANDVTRLRKAFIDAGSATETAPLLDGLLVARFTTPDSRDYELLKARRDALIAAPEVW